MNGPTARGEDLLTLEDYLALPEPEYKLEVSRGRLIREPGPVARHARVQVRVAAAMLAYEERTRAGWALDGASFILAADPLTVRVPDVSFVVAERVPRGYPTGMWHIAPDLAVEILSPSNRPVDIQEKIVDYLEAGVRLIWILDPDSRTASVHRPGRDPFIVREHDALDGGDVLPGLSIRLSAAFQP